MSRYRAALYHLGISGVIFIVLASLVLFVWYPDFFFTIDGGWEGMRILVAVDLVLGPLLTLIVFRSGKPGLKFDLSVIGTIQALCLAGGLWVIYTERPTIFAYYEGHFYSSSAGTYIDYGTQPPDPATYGDRVPAFVYVHLPDDPIEEADLRRLLFRDNLPAWAYSRLYEPLEGHLATIVTQGQPEHSLRERDETGELDSWLREHGGNFEDYAFFPVHSRYRDVHVAIRKSDYEFVGLLDIRAALGDPPDAGTAADTMIGSL